MSDKPSQKLSRPERRRLLRQARKNNNGAGELHLGGKAPGGESQRKLVVALSLLLATCASIAVVHGGKLWFAAPLWLKILGWAGIVGIGVLGFQMWRKSKSSFSMKVRWFWNIALILILGLSIGYFYPQLIREAGDAVNLRKLEKRHEAVVEKTLSWKGEHWSDQQCEAFLDQHAKLQEDVLGRETTPAGIEFRLLMAVGQVGYQAGCAVDFESKAGALLDKDDKWKNNTPWQYNTLRIWVNTDGWPRVGQGCAWEANRARVAGDNELYEAIDEMCNRVEHVKLEPWVPGYYTQRAEMLLELEEEGVRELEEEMERRELMGN